MTKNSFFLILLLTLLSIGGSGTAKAETVTINFSDESTFIINNAGTKGGKDNADIEMGGIRITTNGGYYEKTHATFGRLYLYDGRTFVVTSSVGNITNIEVTCNLASDANAFSDYTHSSNVATKSFSTPVSTFSTTMTANLVDVHRVVVTYTPASTATVTLAPACTDGERYYGTYSYSGSAFVVPSDLTVSEINVSDGKLQFSNYATGAIVPANTGVLVSSATSGDHTVVLSSEAGTSVLGSNNMLKPSGTGITSLAMSTAAPSCTYYRLTMHNGTTLGFYWGAAEGAAFDLAANRAYLAVPTGSSARLSGFDMSNGEQTGVSAPVALPEQADGAAYNLLGVRVGANWKGLVIINGKKCLKK